MTRPGPCSRERHRFDLMSGWCDNGCGWRDDGQSIYHPRPITTPPPELIDITEPRHTRNT